MHDCVLPSDHPAAVVPVMQDSINRRYSLMFLLDFAHTYSDRQFLFLTPQASLYVASGLADMDGHIAHKLLGGLFATAAAHLQVWLHVPSWRLKWCWPEEPEQSKGHWYHTGCWLVRCEGRPSS